MSKLLTALSYVSIRNFRAVRWYALAFSIGLISMIIAILALFDISWLPHYPFNNFYFFGSLLEIVILGFVLAERANQHRKEQTRTQQQLIDQLQENLNQKTELLRIRDEIARDLHDEVGATLTSIAISTKLVQKKVGPERSEVTLILEQIQTDSQDTIHVIRDTVWALNPDNDAPGKLLERMRAVGFQVLTNQDIDFTFESNLAPADLPPFSMEQRRNIYFVFKESLHNIVKHAHATGVAVHIFRQSGKLHIRISDNGSGFKPTQTGDGNANSRELSETGQRGRFFGGCLLETGPGHDRSVTDSGATNYHYWGWRDALIGCSFGFYYTKTKTSCHETFPFAPRPAANQCGYLRPNCFYESDVGWHSERLP